MYVWQVGVRRGHRSRGIGSGMLDALLRRPACRAVHALETHVTPSNAPSRALFRSLARRHGATLQERTGYAGDLFPDSREAERLLRIHPLRGGSR